MIAQSLETMECASIAVLDRTVPQTDKNKFKFFKCKDSRGRELTGLWQRNWRFYCQMEIPGKGTRRVPLLDEHNKPVESVPEAVKARSRLLMDREQGRTPGPRITPPVNDYVVRYINWLESTTAKSPATILKERSSLNGWAKFLKDTRLNHITRKKINEYVVQRTAGDEGVSNRAANLDVIALGHMLKFARDEDLLKGDLPTEGWKPLKYAAPHRSLVPLDQIDKLCTEARSQVAGKPKYENGQFLSDYIYLLAFSGARRQAGVSLLWKQIDWNNRQLTLFTKFEKRVVVDFNEKLEAHLKDLWQRRDPDSPWVFPTPRQGKKGTGYFANPQQILEVVRAGAGMPNFRFHDCRHFFASFCVMSGLDTMTIASFLGHSDGGSFDRESLRTPEPSAQARGSGKDKVHTDRGSGYGCCAWSDAKVC